MNQDNTIMQYELTGEDLILQDVTYINPVEIRCDRSNEDRKIKIHNCVFNKSVAISGDFSELTLYNCVFLDKVMVEKASASGGIKSINLFRSKFNSKHAPDFTKSNCSNFNFQATEFMLKSSFMNMVKLLPPNLASHTVRAPRYLMYCSLLSLLFAPFSFAFIIPICLVGLFLSTTIILAKTESNEKLLALGNENSERYDYLKRKALEQGDHMEAITFTELEDRASWGTDREDPFPVLNILFSVSCNYGRSIIKPIVLLMLEWLLFTLLYLLYAVKDGNLQQSALFSTSNLLPFGVAGKSAIENYGKPLFGNLSSEWPVQIYYLAFAQEVLSLIMLLLVGLAVRNKFKLKV
ncbi:MAG: hypothetical protein QM538_02725 [Methylacidiphilales bacterium]|nr:hypothetical protein [Candidatus Methylacidiphilales bacterium]